MTKKFKDHMEVHKKSFIVDYEAIVQECKQRGIFDCLQNQFEKLTITFNYPVG